MQDKGKISTVPRARPQAVTPCDLDWAEAALTRVWNGHLARKANEGFSDPAAAQAAQSGGAARARTPAQPAASAPPLDSRRALRRVFQF